MALHRGSASDGRIIHALPTRRSISHIPHAFNSHELAHASADTLLFRTTPVPGKLGECWISLAGPSQPTPSPHTPPFCAGVHSIPQVAHTFGYFDANYGLAGVGRETSQFKVFYTNKSCPSRNTPAQGLPKTQRI